MQVRFDEAPFAVEPEAYMFQVMSVSGEDGWQLRYYDRVFPQSEDLKLRLGNDEYIGQADEVLHFLKMFNEDAKALVISESDFKLLRPLFDESNITYTLQ